MINFLLPPEEFALIRIASVNPYQLGRIAHRQFRYANTRVKRANWLWNALKAGVAWVKDLPNKMANLSYGFFQMIIVKAPIVAQITRLFQKLAYKRILVLLHRSWSYGREDKSYDNPMRNERGLRDLHPHLDHPSYVMGYEGKPDSSLPKRAIEIAKRELGARTVSLMIRDALRLINPIPQLRIFFDGEVREYGKVYRFKSKDIPFPHAILLVLKHLFLFVFGLKFMATIGVYGVSGLVVAAMTQYTAKEVFSSNEGAATYSSIAESVREFWIKYVQRKDLLKELSPRDVFVRTNMDTFKSVLEVPKKNIEEADASHPLVAPS